MRRGFRSLLFTPGKRRLTGWAMAAVFVSGLIGLGLLVVAPWGCSSTGRGTAFSTLESRMIRVRLLAGVDQVSFTASMPPLYYSSADPTQRYLNLPTGTAVPVYLSASGWICGRARLGQGQLVFRPARVGSLAVDGKTYRGQYRLVPQGGNRFDVINDVELDDYLKGVVGSELYPDWQPAAYRAQAIVARTYALYEKQTAPERHWDVWGDERSQAYRGLGGENPKSVAAVEATRGIVVVYGPAGDEHIFKAFFASCCGGVTQNVTDAFPNEAYVPVLSAQVVGGVCNISNRFNWGPVIISREELTRRIRQWSVAHGRGEIGLIQSVVIEKRNAGGRPTLFGVVDVRGRKYLLNCEDFRVAANTGARGIEFYSSYVENIINDSDRIRFVGGHGFGHGVGMCQWCAEARARMGISAEDIVRYSYPGAKLVRAY